MWGSVQLTEVGTDVINCQINYWLLFAAASWLVESHLPLLQSLIPFTYKGAVKVKTNQTFMISFPPEDVVLCIKIIELQSPGWSLVTRDLIN